MQHEQAVAVAVFESQRYSASWPAAAIHNGTYLDPTLYAPPFCGWSSEQQPSFPFASMHSAFEPSALVVPTIMGNSGVHATQMATITNTTNASFNNVYLGFPH